jgi:hypothetical protein
MAIIDCPDTADDVAESALGRVMGIKQPAF